MALGPSQDLPEPCDQDRLPNSTGEYRVVLQNQSLVRAQFEGPEQCDEGCEKN